MFTSKVALGLTALALASIPAVAKTPAPAEATESCAAISEQEVAALFDRWHDAAKSGSAAAVAANYAPDAVLLATVQNKPATNTAEITAYFETLLKRQPTATIDQRAIKIGCNKAIDVGTWTFTLSGENGDRVQVPARYTFVYENLGGKWLIAHHHSSMMPEKPDATN